MIKNFYKRFISEKSVSGLLGTAGGASGTGFKSPTAVPITQGTNQGQISAAQGTVNNSLQSQQALLQALQGTNGVSNQANALQSQGQLAGQQAANNAVGNQGNIYAQGQALANQQAGLQATGAQGTALSQQQALNNQLAGAGGVQNQQSALSAQQALAQQQQATAAQYQGIANGTGPNPAQAMLNQQTGVNVANQAALMAGQRGASSNVGLIARQAAQQGAATQQQAVGQGATLQAQQSLNALSGLSAQQQAIGGTQANVANIAAQQVGQQQTGVNAAQSAASNITAQQQAQQQALAGQAATQVGQQQAQQQAIAGLATQQVGQQQTQQQAGTAAALQEQTIQQQALAAQNQAQVSMQSNINAANAGLSQTNMQGQQGVIGGTANAIGAGIGLPGFKAYGGDIEKPIKMADGTDPNNPSDPMSASQYTNPTPIVAPPPLPTVAPLNIATPQIQAPATPQTPGPQSPFGKHVAKQKGPFSMGQGNDPNQQQQGMFQMAGTNSSAQALSQGIGSIGAGIKTAYNKYKNSQNDNGNQANPTSANYQSDADTPPPPDMSNADLDASLNAKGGMIKRDFTVGGSVNALDKKEKAIKSGNSYANDKIPALLSEHEIVIPRSITQSADPIRGSADFVSKVLAKRKK